MKFIIKELDVDNESSPEKFTSHSYSCEKVKVGSVSAVIALQLEEA